MRKGKMIAQGAHASMKAILDFSFKWGEAALCIPIDHSMDKKAQGIGKWLSGKFAKICVGVGSEEELLELFEKAKEADLLCSLITDSGLTEFNGVPTNTCIAIGPAKSEEIDKITGHLKLL
jgi:PTH2 family peptidyl-tRNA hydrolase